ncbi:hypothetical protein HK105_205213 [Polyrhizophydium stewartii]|uniref:EF-hand domain-containing protein n=1 Tax=Polyrhizophydium stewartii TaxID=2732419 RepID=A0ABR4N725_9FUNG
MPLAQEDSFASSIGGHSQRAPRDRLFSFAVGEFIRIFLTSHGVTLDDVSNAFQIISRDGQRITPSDIRLFADKYFGDLPAGAQKLLGEWKETATKDQLCNMLLNKNMASTPWDEAFELRRLAASFSKYGMATKRADQILLARFDKDHDGKIGLEDFKRMSL